MKKSKSIFTKSVHAGLDRTLHHGALSVPVFNASVYAFEDADEGSSIHNYEKPGFFYGRLGNPTQTAVEQAVAELELGDDAIAFASGMAAISSALMSVLRSGDHLIALTSMYSTSNSLFIFLSERFGIDVTYVDATDIENYRNAIRDSTRVIWVESPSNPRLNITDIRALAEVAGEHGILTVADNTFATPFNQNPLEMGIDMTVHSATKYLGGHSDLSAGIVAGSSEHIQRIRDTTNKYFGGNIAPQVAWLVLRGIKTLALRMQRHNENANAVARMLESHPKVKEVFYPGLENHLNHEIAASQMRGFGGMISFDVGGYQDGVAFMNGLEMISIATSLGGVESIAQHSAAMTHAPLSPEQRREAGISEGLIRLSVGIEDIDDIAADIENSLERI